jgi:DNA gyrase subunit A
MRYQIIIDETNEVKEKYGDERKTTIIAAEGELSIEDLINEHQNYISELIDDFIDFTHKMSGR